MANKSEQVLNESLGLPRAVSTVNITVTVASATDTLAADTLYVFTATQDMYINIEETVVAATSSHMLLLADTPMKFKTDGSHVEVSALRVASDGILSMTPLAGTPL